LLVKKRSGITLIEATTPNEIDHNMLVAKINCAFSDVIFGI